MRRRFFSIAVLCLFVLVNFLLALNGPLAHAQPRTRDGAKSNRLADGAHAPGLLKQNAADGLKYVWIPPGTFLMGCSPGDTECQISEKPAHQVQITKGFWIGQTKVTVGAYKRYAKENGATLPDDPKMYDRMLNPGWSQNAMPMVDVNWLQAREYCSWAQGRLPTEAEWEYAARGGSAQARYGRLDEIAWYADNSGKERIESTQIASADASNYVKRINANDNNTHDVARKSPNGFGLFDTLGNAWEWVNDRYQDDYYLGSPAVDPMGPRSGELRVLRGGAWNAKPSVVRVSYRGGHQEAYRAVNMGFRCVGEMVGQ
jgi:formylglycine-generating enzyme required for sulfatase activity